MKIRSALSIASFIAALASAQAATLSVSFPEVDGPTFTGGFPLPPADVDTQLFSLPPGAVLISATLSGTFGATSSFIGSSAHHDLYIDGNLFGGTHDVTPDPYNNVVGFSFTQPNVAGSLAYLLDGEATLSYIQNTEFRVRLSETTLTLEYDAGGGSVPDSTSSISMLAAMAALGLFARVTKQS